MNHRRLIIFAVFLFCFSNTLFAFQSKGSVGKVGVIDKPVFVFRGNKMIMVGGFGTLLKTGDTVITRDGGKGRVTLADGHQIIVAPSSRLLITEALAKDHQKKDTKISLDIIGKIRAKVIRFRSRRLTFKTATAVVGVKGTDFIVEYANGITTVGTLEGLVNMQSFQTAQSVDIPPGKMSSVSPKGEVMKLSDIAGTLLKDVEIAGETLKEEEIAGEKVE